MRGHVRAFRQGRHVAPFQSGVVPPHSMYLIAIIRLPDPLNWRQKYRHMGYLLLVSVLWGFSFGLYREHLTGLDPNLVAFLRLLLALPVLLPFLRPSRIGGRHRWHLLLIGAAQFGLMYSALNFSYQFLYAWQVALFTVLTPIYVAILNDLREGRVQPFNSVMAMLAILGAMVITLRGESWGNFWLGFLILQVSNLCFAYGQVTYRTLRHGPLRHVKDHEVFAWLYLGGVAISLVTATLSGGWNQLPGITGKEWLVILYLGLIASGCCFFWWNKGATLTRVATLAVFNNLKIPVAILIAVWVFGERTDWSRLILGASIMILAAWLSERQHRRRTA